jgi:hypothetical protein
MNKNDVIMGESAEYKELDSAEYIDVGENIYEPSEIMKNLVDLKKKGVDVTGVSRIVVDRSNMPVPEPTDDTEYNSVTVARKECSEDEVLPEIKTDAEEIAEDLQIKGVEFFGVKRPEEEFEPTDDTKYERKSVKRVECDMKKTMCKLAEIEEQLVEFEEEEGVDPFTEERIKMLKTGFKENLTKQRLSLSDGTDKRKEQKERIVKMIEACMTFYERSNPESEDVTMTIKLTKDDVTWKIDNCDLKF